MEYSLCAFFALILTIAPAMVLGAISGYVDSYPLVVCLGLGALFPIVKVGSAIMRGWPEDRKTVEAILQRASERSRQLKQEKRNRRRGGENSKSRAKKGAKRSAPAHPEASVGQVISREDPVDASLTGRRLFRRMLLYAGPPCWAVALGVLSNQCLDTSPAREHRVELREWRRTFKNRAGYAITSSWRTPGGQERLRVLSLTMNVDVPPGSPIIVTTRGGFWGWEWVASIRPETSRNGPFSRNQN